MADSICAPSALQQPQIQPEFWTEEQASVCLNVPVPTLRQWRRTGEGPPWYRFERRLVRYHKQESLTWARARQGQHSSE